MKKTFTDQMGRTVDVQWPPKRILSLVPSQTELLYELGLDEEVVGITKFCIHPVEWFRTKPRVGGTKNFDFDKIAALKPDLIIGNKEENEELQMKQLMELYPVWMSDIHNLDDSLAMIREVGGLVDRQTKANEFVNTIQEGFKGLTPQNKYSSALYFIWREPFMVVSQDTFISNMMVRCGFENIAPIESRYPELSKEDIAKLTPDVILLSSEPFPFAEKHLEEFRQLCPDSKVILVDGEYFSWYGSRLADAPRYFKRLLNDM